MDDSCAVCAENLEWVAYGPCGHREVCSTCVIRLRFICNDRRCCICKTESSTVFVTKALGEYTSMVNDFSLLPAEPREGQVKSYWYHEDSQAFFDDLDQYKMVKAMCRLSCSVCDQMEIQSHDAFRRKGRFRSIEQLKGHLFHRHRLLMCSLCLEGRKVFICEQKLYTRAQLTQHIDTGDSEVDGDERERGGFMGHPMCHFCRTPFYGDNELYSHMSTDHYTCHICQRRHPGQYEYYKNYDDLEIHFRHEHFLCEDEACLAKKFVVFPSEAEIKRHNALEHGGRMSRSKRNAALQIPVSFQYRRNNELERRRGRGPSFRHDRSDDLSAAIEASLQTASASGMPRDPPQTPGSAISDTLVGNNAEGSELHDPIVQPFEVSSTTDSEVSSRYLQALSASTGNQSLQESYFPPLPAAQTTSQPKDKQDPKALPNMAARLRRQSKGVVIHNDSYRGSVSTSVNSNPWPALNNSHVPEASSGQYGTTPPPPSAVATQVQKPPEDVHSANRSLVEKIRAALGFDKGKYTAFRNISADYRKGSLSTESYLASVQQYGLSHLVCDLAQLLPDNQRKKELIEVYTSNLRSWGSDGNREKENRTQNRVKGKKKSTDALADSIMNTVRELQLNYKPHHSQELVETLSKDGYRISKGKSKVIDESEATSSSVMLNNEKISWTSNDLDRSSGSDGLHGKQRKKAPKFLRSRLGEGFDKLCLESNGVASLDPGLGRSGSYSGNAMKGVWRNGGGQKLFSTGSSSR